MKTKKPPAERVKEKDYRTQARYWRYCSHIFRKLALCDSLTGLYSYRYIKERIKQEDGRIRRYMNDEMDVGYSLVFMDLDNMKKLNDTYGHETVNKILKKIGKVISDGIRSGDAAGRYGGDEFILILPETDTAGAEAVVTRIMNRIKETDWKSVDERLDGFEGPTLSAGIAESSNKNYIPYEDLIKNADNALYRSKRNGKNQSTVF